MNTESNSWRRSFMPVVENIPEVRLGARLVLAAWAVPADVSETAVLILSELAANAVRHARIPGRTFDVTLTHDDQKTIEIEVGDGSPHLPVLKPYDPEATSGRGLLLVEALADTWEVRHREFGKTVWARVLA
ncbi:ATP-binding protein [Streptomyces sp. NPDC050759]|uniref:ATP-binding protein n=1 Tax=Streptomyces sp. NPDC050759 TaxID=3365635 RepID=UPI00379729AD